MSEWAVSVRDLSKEFGSLKAVDGLTFDLEPGGIVALLGGNGAGKTTTIAMLLGLLLPTSGTVHALGADMTRDRYRALGRMNFSSPYVELPGRLTAEENLLVYARLYGVPQAGRYAEVLNTDSAHYGGSDSGNLGDIGSDDVAMHGFAQSLPLTLPPLSVLVLEWTGAG